MTQSIAIVGGGGGVGSSLAFNLLLHAEPHEIALVDGESGRARSHEMDLQLVLAAGVTGSVRVVGLDEIAGADVVVMCAAVPQRPNTSRMVDLRRNAAILDDVTRVLAREPGWPGVLLVVTNPVDVLVTRAQRLTGLPRERVLGYTANDGLRLRSAVATALGVSPARVEAWVIGEHGDGCVPLLDRVTVDGEPVVLSGEQRTAAAGFVRGWYVRHVALDPGRSSTWTSGHGVARMVAALAGSSPGRWPVSLVLTGEYGVSGVALGAPVDVTRGGVARVHEWPLSAEETAAMAAAARVVGAAVDGLDRGGDG